MDTLFRDVVPVQAPSDDGHGKTNRSTGYVENVADLQVDPGWWWLDDSGLGWKEIVVN